MSAMDTHPVAKIPTISSKPFGLHFLYKNKMFATLKNKGEIKDERCKKGNEYEIPLGIYCQRLIYRIHDL